MVEVNRSLYMDEKGAKNGNFEIIQGQIQTLLRAVKGSSERIEIKKPRRSDKL
jgi:N-formylglutamate amidohydrolase